MMMPSSASMRFCIEDGMESSIVSKSELNRDVNLPLGVRLKKSKVAPIVDFRS